MYLELTKTICSGVSSHVAQVPGEWMLVLRLDLDSEILNPF